MVPAFISQIDFMTKSILHGVSPYRRYS